MSRTGKMKTMNNPQVDTTPGRDRLVRLTYIAMGMVILGYVYTDSLQAQQAAQQRISISEAADFPSDI